jgi:4-amino-4-deoxy-L-arabinose transferase-like glycosyltransferase
MPFMVFFYASLLCFLVGWYSKESKKRYFFFSGMLCGISMLVRPIAVGAGLFMAILMFFRRRCDLQKKFVFALLIVLGNLIVVLPWEIWMYRETHEAGLLCHGRDAISMADGLTFAMNFEGFRKGSPVPQDVRKFMEEFAPSISFSITTKQVMRLVLAEFEKHPLTVIKLFAIKAVRSWYGTNSNRYELIIIIIQAFYLALMVIASLRYWKSRKDCRFPLVIGLVLLMYFWGMTVSVLSIVRYMVPVLGLMFVFFPALKPPDVFPPRRPPRANLPPA